MGKSMKKAGPALPAGLSTLLESGSPLAQPARFAIMMTLMRTGGQTVSDLKEHLPLTFGNLD